MNIQLLKGSSVEIKENKIVSISIKYEHNVVPLSCTMYMLDINGNALEKSNLGVNQDIQISLDTLPSRIHNISFVISADNAECMQSSQIKVFMPKLEICTYILNEPITSETAYIMGEFYRFNKRWRFRAVGQGFCGGLHAISKYFGST